MKAVKAAVVKVVAVKAEAVKAEAGRFRLRSAYLFPCVKIDLYRAPLGICLIRPCHVGNRQWPPFHTSRGENSAARSTTNKPSTSLVMPPSSPDIPEAPWREPGQPPTTRPMSARPSAAAPEPTAPLSARPATARPSTAGPARAAASSSKAEQDIWGPKRAQRKPRLDTGNINNKGYSKQSLYVKPQAPKYGFGSASRDQVNKLFISQQHTLTIMAGKGSPGPAQYVLPPSVGGKQPDGRKPDPPVWGMGGAERFAYGYCSRQERQRNSVAPGPFTYSKPSSVGGKQPDGRHADAPLYGFGSASRDQVNKLFISQQHTLTLMAGKGSPGPAGYTLPPSVGGKQPDGRKKDPPCWTLSKSPRVTMDDEEIGKRSPGPGANYHIPSVTTGPQVQARRSSSTAGPGTHSLLPVVAAACGRCCLRSLLLACHLPACSLRSPL